MPSNKPKWLITVTEEMDGQMNNLILSDGWTMNKSETIRAAIVEYLQKHGISAEDNMPSHGGDRTKGD